MTFFFFIIDRFSLLGFIRRVQRMFLMVYSQRKLASIELCKVALSIPIMALLSGLSNKPMGSAIPDMNSIAAQYGGEEKHNLRS